ncbi:hypothetical protein G3T14_19705 [Methylobacterium sp. BTF04]|uniref:hypothetical protein n=1 Tax=Methylobacterium sp. BTF04 TaxID=2708300 RepID=UPI0013D6F4A1|nr:hypothetical protein [Methylobacterium sp. BTF04]NEU14335.1 hypothetical protein [Methylobacterium sp. BTF04]
MSELDLDDLTAEIFKRVLRMRSTLDEGEFDLLAGEIMLAMGAAAMRKAEDRARSVRWSAESRSLPNVIHFPGPASDARVGGVGDTTKGNR